MNELNVFELPVFADADLLPMLADDEMADMVESIKANGQREPITVAEINGEWFLIDGRNRREACRQAEVDPKYRIFEGDESAIKAFILDTDTRRHNRRAQRSMRLAFMYPETQQGKRNDLVDKSTKLSNLKKQEQTDLNMARFVRKHDEPLGRLILAGHPNYTLTKAYEEVKAAVAERERLAELERQKLEKLAELRNSYPDLATLVDEGRIYLDEALETAASRDRKAQEEAERIQREAAEKKRLEEEAKRAAMAEEERKIKEEQEKERYLYEADRATFTAWLKDMYHSAIIADTASAKIEIFRGEWDWFEGKTGIKYGDLKQRLNNLQAAIPDLLQLIESMHHV